MKDNKDIKDRIAQQSFEKSLNRRFKGNNLIWIIFITVALYAFLSGLLQMMISALVNKAGDWSPEMAFVNEFYTHTIGAVITLIIICWMVKKNGFILRSFLPKGKGKNFRIQVEEDQYVASQNNTVKNLLIGLLLGFITNFTCILCAIAHGDIKLYFDFSASQIPAFIYAFLMVFIQSTSEELWCRGYMYERINIHYPLWVSVVVNGVFFGLLHIANPGVSVMAIIGIVVCGLSYSLVRWYTGSIWVVMGIHTMWNYTQNFIFGLPNSGLVSEASIFHLDAANGVSNLIYDFSFGVEAALPALLVDAALGIGVLYLAHKQGRLGELNMSYEKRLAQQKAAQQLAEVTDYTSEETEVTD